MFHIASSCPPYCVGVYETIRVQLSLPGMQKTGTEREAGGAQSTKYFCLTVNLFIYSFIYFKYTFP